MSRKDIEVSRHMDSWKRSGNLNLRNNPVRIRELLYPRTEHPVLLISMHCERSSSIK